MRRVTERLATEVSSSTVGVQERTCAAKEWSRRQPIGKPFRVARGKAEMALYIFNRLPQERTGSSLATCVHWGRQRRAQRKVETPEGVPSRPACIAQPSMN